MKTLETDYLVVGCGAVGMAFCDVLLNHSDARLVIVDRHKAPGGHWNDAYSFVRLHQPSAYYGVCSKPLGDDGQDPDPLNAGMLERASAAELLAYYAEVMADFIATGRVIYLPEADYFGDGHVTSLSSGDSYHVKPTRRIVDTTYLQTVVPSTHPPKYQIGQGVACLTPNALAGLDLPIRGQNYCVIGAGKTGVDVCLYLLERGVDPDAIRWIMPRDAWFQNRANVQRGDSYFEATFGALAAQMAAVAEAKTSDGLMLDLEAKGQLLRLDPHVTPRMYHGAIMSIGERDRLCRIKDVIRKGRIEAITFDQICFAGDAIEARPNTIYIDCSASGLTKRPAVTVFEGNTITLQMVKPIQPVFSGALIARVELLCASDEDKNALCGPVMVPDAPLHWLNVLSEGLANQARWSRHGDIKSWIASTRLDTFGKMARRVKPHETQKLELLNRFSASVGPALLNATRLLRQHPPRESQT